MKQFLKNILARTPYRIVHASAKNRFGAIEEVIAQLRERGYSPRRIVDGGANVGDFAKFCRSLFPSAQIALIEPQPACQPALEALSTSPGFALHPVAIGSKKGELELAIDPEGVTTGAHIVAYANPTESNRRTSVPVETLDAMLGPLDQADRTFLKLDLQGWELEALRGAEQVLPTIEVILCEVSFFAQAYEPPIQDLIRHLAERGFVLYDIASITGRSRDNRARQGDFVFVRQDSALMQDKAWV